MPSTLEQSPTWPIFPLDVSVWSAGDGARHYDNLVRVSKNSGLSRIFTADDDACEIWDACRSDVLRDHTPELVLIMHSPIRIGTGSFVSGFRPGNPEVIMVPVDPNYDVPVKTVCVFAMR